MLKANYSGKAINITKTIAPHAYLTHLLLIMVLVMDMLLP